MNYTTKIASHTTVGQIHRILAQAGAGAVNTEYDQQTNPIALTFGIEVKGHWVNFRLPSRWHGVERKLNEDPKVPKRLRTEEQARRIAWRIIKDWIEAQMAIIQADLATLPEVFLPYAITQSGRTLYQDFEAGNLLTSGEQAK